MRPTVYTDALPDDEYGDFLRSRGDTAARIERRDFLDDEEPDLDLFADPESYQREAEKSSDGPPAEGPVDPLQETLDLIPRSTLGASLVKYLFQRKERSAKLPNASKRIYKSIDKPSLHKMRKVIRETRTALENRDAPLRLTWNKKTRIVMLISRDET
jgi:hypothetical protein